MIIKNMALFRKESLDALKERIDLVEVVGSVVELKPAGTAYKALCPFHDEKTPSFAIQRGDKHYHCFGCGAHGDAIQFLMGSQQLSFTDAVERLGQQFGVHLEKTEEKEGSGIGKDQLKRALEAACSCYQEILLHTEEGHEALQYLYKRGCDHDFIDRFRLGYAPKDGHFMRKFLR
jgi:DNA primase